MIPLRVRHRIRLLGMVGRRVGLSLAGAMLSAAALPAQGSVYAVAGGSWRSGTIAAGQWLCGDRSMQPLPGSVSTASCAGGPEFEGFFGGAGAFESAFLASAGATARAGSIGASALVSWFAKKDDDLPSSMFPELISSATGEARWTDRASFQPVSALGAPPLAFLDITFDLHGTIAGKEGLNYEIPGFGTAWAGTALGQVAFGGGTVGNSFFASEVIRIGREKSAMPPIARTQTLRVGINGLTSNAFTILLTANASVSLGPFFGAYTFEGSMESAFNHTVTPVSYRLFDAQLNDVSAAYTTTFENGLRIGGPATTVPEPSTVVLLALGGAGLLLARWRTRGRRAR